MSAPAPLTKTSKVKFSSANKGYSSLSESSLECVILLGVQKARKKQQKSQNQQRATHQGALSQCHLGSYHIRNSCNKQLNISLYFGRKRLALFPLI